MTDSPSLWLSLAPRSEYVRIEASKNFSRELQALATRFHSVVGRNGLVEVDLETFMTQLAQLALWPDEVVEWDPPLRRIVLDGLRDADAATRALEAGVAAPVIPDEVRHRLGPDWTGDLTDFQMRDLGRLLSATHGANFSVPGAGKTRVALGVFAACRTDGIERLLVVAPKSAFESWESEVSECFAGEPLTIGRVFGDVALGTDVLLVNYERLPQLTGQLITWLRHNDSMVVLDEAHRMKLGDAGAYGSACLSIGPFARRRLILTGTPAPNGVADLKSLFSFVWPGTGKRAVHRAVGDGDLVAAGRALKPLYVRTKKSELGLPTPITREVFVELPPRHREIYNALLGQDSGLEGDVSDDFIRMGRVIMYMLMAADSPALLALGGSRYEPLEFRIPPLVPAKGIALEELMRDLPDFELSPKFREAVAIALANARVGRKTLIWSNFIRSIRTLERMMANLQPAVVHGGTEDRGAELDRFRYDSECRVLISNPATLGEGVSLHQICHDAVYVDRDFAAGRYLQSLDRIHRLGLPRDAETNVTILTAAGTIDEVVSQRLATKLEFLSAVLDDPDIRRMGDLAEEEAIGAGLTQGDLEAVMGHIHGISS
jgi:hypothetical protein